MVRLKWFIIGAVSMLMVAAAGVFLGFNQAQGFSTRQRPTFLERWAARGARSLALPADAKSRSNPVSESAEAVAEGRAHWADHCAVCHANNGSGDTEMGQHMYPPAPDMREGDTQDLTDGELFYIIQNGIRLTGMPAWGSGKGKDELDSWKLVRFIRHLPELTADEEREMQELNPKGPDELREEQEEREFLNGNESNARTRKGDQSHEQMQHQHD